MAWPKGRSRKPQPEQEPKPKPEADAELIDPVAELLDVDEDKSKPSKLPPAAAKAKAKADAPRSKWTLSERAKHAAEDTEWRDRTSDNLFALPEEAHAYLRDNNLVAQWCTVSVLGQEQRRHFAGLQANGWTPVHANEMPGVSETLIEGTTQLCVRSKTIHDRALKAQREAALGPIRNREQAVIEGIPGVKGSDHVTARNYNRIRKSVERLDIPRDD